MKKFLILAALSAVLLSCGSNRDQILKVYNWSDYIDESVLPEFEAWYKAQTGEEIEVVYQTFDVNETMLSKIEKGRFHQLYRLKQVSLYPAGIPGYQSEYRRQRLFRGLYVGYDRHYLQHREGHSRRGRYLGCHPQSQVRRTDPHQGRSPRRIRSGAHLPEAEGTQRRGSHSPGTHAGFFLRSRTISSRSRTVSWAGRPISERTR